MLVMMFISSCKNDSTEGLTFITHYPTLTLEGESFMVVEKGTTFYEPGYLAILHDEDVTNQVEVISEVNMNQSGLYSIFYKITNVEGFAKIASRQVLVVDFNDLISYDSNYLLYILANGDGTYTINDMLGGYYEQGADYGSDYAMIGVFTIDEDGAITALSGDVVGWGDSMDYLEDGVYDATTGTISWNLGYAGMEFYVIMNKWN